METKLTNEDARRIFEGIRRKYGEVAQKAEGHFAYPTGRAGLEAQKYPAHVLEALPESVAASYCGVGNPFSLGEIRKGEAVLDIGCGAGVDAIFAARMAGSNGKVVGTDISREMLARARENIEAMNLDNVTLMEGSPEDLDFPDESFDVVLSNGVFNLMPDKEGACAAAFRLLKPGGRLMVADQVLAGPPEKDLKSRVDTWFQ